MQRRKLLAGLVAATAVGCGRTQVGDVPPLLQGRLQVITLAGDAPGAVDRIRESGYEPVTLPPNYPQATAVEAAVFGVPETAAAGAQYFSSKAGAADLRLLSTPAAGGGGIGDSDRSFFRQVLGTDVPAWPLKQAAADDLKIQVLTYVVADVLEANRRLRENGIAVVYDPVAITTAYQGDHRMLAIRAPGGTVVQLVQSTAQ